MKMCSKCHKAHKTNKWYLNGSEEIVAEKLCEVHPSLDNKRVSRTLRSLKYWSLCGENYRHSNMKGVRLVLSFQRIHRRTAESILFDYEKPFVELLIKEGILDEEKDFDGVNRALRVTDKWKDYLMNALNAKEWEYFQGELKEAALKEVAPASE